MSSNSWLIFIAVCVVVVLALRNLHARRVVSERDAHLAARQTAIQSALDRAGAVLKDEHTTLAAGDIAAARVLQELAALNHDGSLGELIADTELFVEEWRASKRPA